MSKSNFFWGLGGVILGAVTTYFVMEYIYEKELNELYAIDHPEDVKSDTSDEPFTVEGKKVIALDDDTEMYPTGEDKFLHRIVEEEAAEGDEASILEAMRAEEEENNDPDLLVEGSAEQEEGDDVSVVDVYTGYNIIEIAQVHPGRRIVARFNHDDCSLDISSVMSVKTELFDESVDESMLEELLGEEAYTILMNSEPDKKERMLGVRNNVINLDFAISY
jgi:hypothetical protein